MFYRRLSAMHRTLAAIGSFLLVAGLLAAVLIGCLAPFPQTYEPLHIPLAYATFISVSAGPGGLFGCCGAAGRHNRAGLPGMAAVRW